MLTKQKKKDARSYPKHSEINEGEKKHKSASAHRLHCASDESLYGDPNMLSDIFSSSFLCGLL